MGRKNMDFKTRNNLGQFLWKSSNDGRLGGKVVAEAIAKFQVCKKTVYLIWAEAMEQKKAGLPIYLASKKKGCKKTSRKINLDPDIIKLVPFHKRKTYRDLSSCTGYSKSSIGRMVLSGEIRAHTNAIKPRLTINNKLARLYYCLAALTFDAATQKVTFKSMDATIHVDEKWFNLSTESLRVYLTEDEVGPYRACQSKTHIPKVMFNCAVSRPIYSSDGELIFDGKIGLWEFTEPVAAKRKSKNRAKGTIETKPILSVNKEVTKAMLIDKVIPAIHAKWPPNATKNIIIQWDNAPPHIKNNDPEFRAAASANGFNINLYFQPPNSPDTNINDLGWFRSIQSLKTDIQPKNIDEVVSNTHISFDRLCHTTLNKVFLSLQGCMVKIMGVMGDNKYDLPHQKKDAQAAMGTLPRDLEVDVGLVKECLAFLKEAGCAGGLEELMADLEMN